MYEGRPCSTPVLGASYKTSIWSELYVYCLGHDIGYGREKQLMKPASHRRMIRRVDQGCHTCDRSSMEPGGQLVDSGGQFGNTARSVPDRRSDTGYR